MLALGFVWAAETIIIFIQSYGPVMFTKSNIEGKSIRMLFWYLSLYF